MSAALHLDQTGRNLQRSAVRSLIDEWVAYLRQIYKVDGICLPVRSIQTCHLFESCQQRRSKQAPQTLPDGVSPHLKSKSAVVKGGPCARLKQTFSRVESSWRPPLARESWRNCTPPPVQGDSRRYVPSQDNTLANGRKLYRENTERFCALTKTIVKLEKAYPIHPELS